ncbi:hypothetical protein PoB_006271800 [Plakobranchus ocellatus]|uniref:Peptidase S8 pro-domain domain-containing protein n=1 Tax=Plakobranchus ocellatus TaxID=259542 RepID=A0AAV4CWE0_9GAST|nr:hypothetical protein PoB_006271800 [Plakobranchus ocellatus]
MPSWRMYHTDILVTLTLTVTLCWMGCQFCCAHEHTFINEFAVHIEGGPHVADRVAREAGLVNRGQRLLTCAQFEENTLCPVCSLHGLAFYPCILILWDVGGTVANESALRSAGTLLSRFEPRYRRPGLMEGLKT